MDAKTHLPDGLPAPRPDADGLDAPFWEATAHGVLTVQRCTHCGTWLWGPEWICHHCLAFDPGWTEIEPHGRIYSWSRAWHPVHPALKDHGPYLFVLVEIPHAGNVRMLGNLLGDPMQRVEIGAPVEAVFEPHASAGGAYTLVQWRNRS